MKNTRFAGECNTKNKMLMKHLFLKTLLWGAVLPVCLFSCSSDDPPGPQPLPEPTLNPSDSLALTELYKAYDGDNWDVTWDLTDYRTWGGVSAVYDSAHNEYRVFKVILNQTSTPVPQGYISEAIGDIPYLMDFRVGGRGLRGSIPEGLFKLPYVQLVRIAGTSISGEIPGFVFQAPSLYWLDLDGNELYGEIPDEITEWDNPEGHCSLRQNHLSGKVPSGIKIKELWLRSNDFTEFPFEYCFSDYPVISMPENHFGGAIPDEVLADPEAMRRLWSWSASDDFTNLPDWWLNGERPPKQPEEEEGSGQAVQTSQTAMPPLRTRMELRTDIQLPGR